MTDGSTPRSDQFAPTVLGYEITGELGRGGMGVVYMARHIRLNRNCALKMILAGLHASPEHVARFVTEAEAIARLAHPGIVQIRSIGEADGLPFLELEYVAGGSLDRQLNGTPWPWAKAAHLAERVAVAIAEAHRQSRQDDILEPIRCRPRRAAGAQEQLDVREWRQSGAFSEHRQVTRRAGGSPHRNRAHHHDCAGSSPQ